MGMDISKSQQDLNSAVEAWIEHHYFGTVNNQSTKSEVVNLNLVLAWESFSKSILESKDDDKRGKKMRYRVSWKDLSTNFEGHGDWSHDLSLLVSTVEENNKLHPKLLHWIEAETDMALDAAVKPERTYGSFGYGKIRD